MLDHVKGLATKETTTTTTQAASKSRGRRKGRDDDHDHGACASHPPTHQAYFSNSKHRREQSKGSLFLVQKAAEEENIREK